MNTVCRDGGIWIKRNQGGWLKLHPDGPEMMAVGDLDNNGRDDIIVDFGVSGLWVYLNDTNCVKELGNSPYVIATGDVDGSGQDDITATFTSVAPGIFVKRNQGAFQELDNRSPDSNLAVGDLDQSSLPKVRERLSGKNREK